MPEMRDAPPHIHGDKMQCQSAEMRDFVCMFVFDHEMVRCSRRVLLHVLHARR